MLKLWLVVRVLGDVVMSIGPVTVDMPACQAWAQETVVVVDPTGIKQDDITVTCEWSALQPGVR